MSDKQQLEKAIKLCAPGARDEMEIVESNDLRHPVLIRVDNNIPKVFVPRMPQSAAVTENNTVPRVVTADTLIGCMHGHAHIFWLVKSREPGYEHKNHLFKISGFEPKVAVKPSKKLVFDVPETGEMWLMAYNEKTTHWVPIPYGELFVTEVRIVPNAGSEVNTEIAKFCVSVPDQRGLWLTPKIFLEKGFYYVTMDVTLYGMGNQAQKQTGLKRFNMNNTPLSHISISEAAYKSFRKLVLGK
jgi:hypothetical protein